MKNIFQSLVPVFGATLALVFSLLTAFLPGLAYGKVVNGAVFPYYGPFGPFRFQIYECTIGMLVSSVGALLGLSYSLKGRYVHLGSAGVPLALSGFLLLRIPVLYYIPEYPRPILLFWWGPGLTMLGIVMMFWGFVGQSRVVPRLLLLGCPLLLVAWILQPLLVTINLPLLIAMEGSGFMDTSVMALNLSGFLPTLAGCLIGIEKESKRIKGSDLMPFTFLFLSFLMILYLLALFISTLA